MSAERRTRLQTLLRERCFLRGSFRLAGGGTSAVYFDCKRVTLDPEGLALTADLLLDAVEELRAEGTEIVAVGGPSIGADPIAAGMAVRSWERGRPLPSFLIRSAPKDHGTARLLENEPPPGSAVLIVEDVVTSGRSVREAIAKVEASGLRVAAVGCIVDREQGGREALADYRLVALFRRSELEA